MRSAAECAGLLFVDVLFAHPEVGELDVALLGQHYVLQLKVRAIHVTKLWKSEGYFVFWRRSPWTWFDVRSLFIIFCMSVKMVASY